MLFAGLLACGSIVGTPLGVVCFKQVMPIALPFGRDKPAFSGVTTINNNRD